MKKNCVGAGVWSKHYFKLVWQFIWCSSQSFAIIHVLSLSIICCSRASDSRFSNTLLQCSLIFARTYIADRYLLGIRSVCPTSFMPASDVAASKAYCQVSSLAQQISNLFSQLAILRGILRCIIYSAGVYSVFTLESNIP